MRFWLSQGRILTLDSGRVRGLACCPAFCRGTGLGLHAGNPEIVFLTAPLLGRFWLRVREPPCPRTASPTLAARSPERERRCRWAAQRSKWPAEAQPSSAASARLSRGRSADGRGGLQGSARSYAERRVD